MLWPWGILAVMFLAFAAMVVIGSEVRRYRQSPDDLKPLPIEGAGAGLDGSPVIVSIADDISPTRH